MASTENNATTEESQASKRNSSSSDEKESAVPKKAKIDKERSTNLAQTNAYGKLILFGEHFVVYKVSSSFTFIPLRSRLLYKRPRVIDFLILSLFGICLTSLFGRCLLWLVQCQTILIARSKLAM